MLACIVFSISFLSRRYADTAALDKAREGVYKVIEEDEISFVIRRKSRLVTAMKALQVGSFLQILLPPSLPILPWIQASSLSRRRTVTNDDGKKIEAGPSLEENFVLGSNDRAGISEPGWTKEQLSHVKHQVGTLASALHVEKPVGLPEDFVMASAKPVGRGTLEHARTLERAKSIIPPSPHPEPGQASKKPVAHANRKSRVDIAAAAAAAAAATSRTVGADAEPTAPKSPRGRRAALPAIFLHDLHHSSPAGATCSKCGMLPVRVEALFDGSEHFFCTPICAKMFFGQRGRTVKDKTSAAPIVSNSEAAEVTLQQNTSTSGGRLRALSNYLDRKELHKEAYERLKARTALQQSDFSESQIPSEWHTDDSHTTVDSTESNSQMVHKVVSSGGLKRSSVVGQPRKQMSWAMVDESGGEPANQVPSALKKSVAKGGGVRRSVCFSDDLLIPATTSNQAMQACDNEIGSDFAEAAGEDGDVLDSGASICIPEPLDLSLVNDSSLLTDEFLLVPRLLAHSQDVKGMLDFTSESCGLGNPALEGSATAVAAIAGAVQAAEQTELYAEPAQQTSRAPPEMEFECVQAGADVEHRSSAGAGADNTSSRIPPVTERAAVAAHDNVPHTGPDNADAVPVPDFPSYEGGTLSEIIGRISALAVDAEAEAATLPTDAILSDSAHKSHLNPLNGKAPSAEAGFAASESRMRASETVRSDPALQSHVSIEVESAIELTAVASSVGQDVHASGQVPYVTLDDVAHDAPTATASEFDTAAPPPCGVPSEDGTAQADALVSVPADAGAISDSTAASATTKFDGATTLAGHFDYAAGVASSSVHNDAGTEHALADIDADVLPIRQDMSALEQAPVTAPKNMDFPAKQSKLHLAALAAAESVAALPTSNALDTSLSAVYTGAALVEAVTIKAWQSLVSPVDAAGDPPDRVRMASIFGELVDAARVAEAQTPSAESDRDSNSDASSHASDASARFAQPLTSKSFRRAHEPSRVRLACQAPQVLSHRDQRYLEDTVDPLSSHQPPRQLPDKDPAHTHKHIGAVEPFHMHGVGPQPQIPSHTTGSEPVAGLASACKDGSTLLVEGHLREFSCPLRDLDRGQGAVETAHALKGKVLKAIEPRRAKTTSSSRGPRRDPRIASDGGTSWSHQLKLLAADQNSSQPLDHFDMIVASYTVPWSFGGSLTSTFSLSDRHEDHGYNSHASLPLISDVGKEALRVDVPTAQGCNRISPRHVRPGKSTLLPMGHHPRSTGMEFSQTPAVVTHYRSAPFVSSGAASERSHLISRPSISLPIINSARLKGSERMTGDATRLGEGRVLLRHLQTQAVTLDSKAI